MTSLILNHLVMLSDVLVTVCLLTNQENVRVGVCVDWLCDRHT